MTGAQFRPTARDVALSVLAAVVAVAGLTMLARADGQGARLRELQAAAKLGAGPAGGQPVAEVGPCHRALPIESDAAVSLARSAAARAGVDLVGLQTGPLTTPLPIDLAGARLDLAGRGDERAVTAYLKALAASRLSIFVDEAILSRRPEGGLDLHVTGRVLCRRGYR